jgi:hypothetical protein
MDKISYHNRLHKAQMNIIAAVEVLVGTTQGLTLPQPSKRDADHKNLVSWEHLAAWLGERAVDFTSDGFGAGDDATVSDGFEDDDIVEANEFIEEPDAIDAEFGGLQDLSLADLRDLAEAAGIEVAGRRKADYIEALKAHGAE